MKIIISALLGLGILCLTPHAQSNQEQVKKAHESHVLHWMNTLEKHPMVLVRANAARFLGDLQDRVAVPTLIRALNDTNKEVLLQAVRALGKLGDGSAIKPLYELSNRYKGNPLDREARRSVEKIRAYIQFKKKQRSR